MTWVLRVRLAHHVHLCSVHGVHCVHGIVRVGVQALLKLLLAEGGHGEKLLSDGGAVLFLGLRCEVGVVLELQGLAKDFLFVGVGLEQAVRGEKLQSEPASLLGADLLLPARGCLFLGLPEMPQQHLLYVLAIRLGVGGHHVGEVWVVHGGGGRGRLCSSTTASGTEGAAQVRGKVAMLCDHAAALGEEDSGRQQEAVERVSHKRRFTARAGRCGVGGVEQRAGLDERLLGRQHPRVWRRASEA